MFNYHSYCSKFPYIFIYVIKFKDLGWYGAITLIDLIQNTSILIKLLLIKLFVNLAEWFLCLTALAIATSFFGIIILAKRF